MRGSFCLWPVLVWTLCVTADLDARTAREADRLRAIDQMERRLQASAASKRVPLSGKTGAPVTNSTGAGNAAKSSTSSGLLERLFGKGATTPAPSPAVALRPVSGKPVKAASPNGPGKSSLEATSPGMALQSEMKSSSDAIVMPAAKPRGGGGSDLRGLVNSLLAKMGPANSGPPGGDVMEAGSYSFEDFVYEQRKREGEFAPQAEPGAGDWPEPADSNRLMELLAQEEVIRPSKGGSTPEMKRSSATAMLAAAGQTTGGIEAPAVPPSPEPDAVPMEGQSTTYKKALAKLQTYEAPAPPPLRAVSGFQGLMKTKPSEQTVEQSRTGVLSALKLE